MTAITAMMRTLAAAALVIGTWMALAAGPASAEPLEPGQDCIDQFEDRDEDDPDLEGVDLPPCPEDGEEDDGSALGPVLMAWLLGLAMGGAVVGALLRTRSGPDGPGPGPVVPPPPPDRIISPADLSIDGTANGLLTSARALARDLDREAYRLIVERAIDAAQDHPDSEQRGSEIADGLIRLDRHLFEQRDTQHLPRVRRILQHGGFSLVQPNPGDPFDELKHRAVDRAPTDDPALHNTIKEVWTPGFYDNRADRMREFPTVVIHRLDRQPAT